ncbi:MAG: hypothetical protein N3F05_02605 [Candidatus Diapherotrites archaeon]|nr:hypothetical protein [Candidatus Diapherotrites archaeon]
MKKMNVKRLAALGAGIALLGTALAPVASAISLTRSDVINANGAPVYDIVVGAKASSDALWAGNIAAKLAQLAYTDSAVTCTVDRSTIGAGGQEVKPQATVSGLNVELVIGGETTYGEGTAYIYDDSYLNSTAAELDAPIELGNSKIKSLKNESWGYTYNGANYSQTVREFIVVNPDAKFETNREVKDLVLYMPKAGDFTYRVTLSGGVPLDFNKTNKYNITVPLFGKKYSVLKTNADGTELTLIDEAAKRTIDAGQTITDLVGKGSYKGKSLSVRFVSLTMSKYLGGDTYYTGKFQLLDPEGNVIATEDKVEEGEFLEQVFYVNGEYPLETSIYVDTLFKQDVDNANKATITVGTNTVKLKDGEKYPYDERVTSSSEKYWLAKLFKGTGTVGGTSQDVINKIEIYNNAVEGYSKWDRKMPIYAKKDTLTGKGDKSEAIFLNGEPSTALGYGFAKVVFQGFKSETMTELKIKDHKIYYVDEGDTQHEIPLYISGLDSTTEESFNFDKLGTQKYYFRMRLADDYELGCEDDDCQGCFQLSDEPFRNTDFDLDCDSPGYYPFYADDVGEGPLALTGDNGMDYDYEYYYSSTDNAIWFLFAPQKLEGKGGYKLEFLGTDTTEDLGIDSEYYLPNEYELGGGKSGEYYTAVFELTEPTGGGSGKIYIDTEDGSLAPFGNTNYSASGYEFKYKHLGTDQELNLTQYQASTNVQTAYSDYGSKYDISQDYFQAWIPDKRRYIRYDIIGPAASGSTIVGGETLLLNEGEEKVTSAGTRITAKKINYNVSVTPTVCPAGGVVIENIRATPSVSTAKRIVPVGQLVFTHDAALSGKPKIIIGGWKVNRFAKDITLSDGKKITERLTAKGDYVVDKLNDGTIIVAGYTAADTEAAARELIRELDRLLG